MEQDIIMKPNYCSGTILPNRLCSVSNIRSKSSSVQNGAKDGSSQCRSGTRRLQPPHQSKINNSSSSSCFSASKTTSTPRPSSPFIVYRSAKYVKPHARFLKRAHGYAKYYVVIPAVQLANQCKHAVYQLCGLLLLVLVVPLLILVLLGLFVVRRLRMLLIQRLYPGLYPVNDHYSYKTYETNKLLSVDVVNSLVWTRGKLDVETIRKKFKLLLSENQHLQHLLSLRLDSKLGASVWGASESFTLENHIVESPKMILNCPIVDEPIKELYRMGSNRSILKTCISNCVSTPLDCTAPPWKIHVVSYISREDGIKEKTCLVIRMHVALINNRYVRNALRELFINSAFVYNNAIGPCLDEKSLSSNAIGVPDNKENVNDETGEANSHVPVWSIKWKPFCIGEAITEISYYQQKNLRAWLTLRLKQLEFHSKPFVLSIILIDIKHALKHFVPSLEVIVCELWISLLCCVKYIIESLQALAAIPLIIIASIFRRTRFDKLGLQRNADTKRLISISWSDLLHGDLIEEICKKTGTTSPGNVIMMACAYALKDYYQQNNIQDPGKLGFTVGNPNNDFLSVMSLKTIRVPCHGPTYYSSKTSEELQRMEDDLQNYPKWKLLGLWYTLKYSSYFMPTFLVKKMQRRIVSCYPFLFTHLNFNSVNSVLGSNEPIHQIYGEIVEEFALWQLPPFSDFGVSITLVQYSERVRIFVMSPFKSMDMILTQRCNQYLIKIAEDVGVERSKIPYSRRSSPASTSCSTPQMPQYILNHSEKCSLEFNRRI